eukprot:Tamp_18323.p1 GENE.Tamp_18323~~Tamp_18323.p1  ORF type:complete len:371 (-),score=46.11 Tamp_18323:144-1256(-)
MRAAAAAARCTPLLSSTPKAPGDAAACGGRACAAVTLPRATAQATVARTVTFRGIGLHTGEACELAVSPAPADHGITFQRPPALPVRATCGSVIDTTLSTVLASAPPAPLGRRAQRAGYLLSRLGVTAGAWLAGSTVATVEHLMAALSGAGIHNAAISMTGGEVPIMDGSARDFTTALSAQKCCIPRSRLRRVVVQREVVVEAGRGGAGGAQRRVSLTPWNPDVEDERGRAICGQLLLSIKVDYGDFIRCPLGAQSAQTFEMERSQFLSLAADARTFCFAHDIAWLRRWGLARGGSLENAVVFENGHVLNAGGLRYSNEVARHKALDALGDLALGGVLVGVYRGDKPGHALNVALLRRLFSSPQNYCISD